MIYVSRNMQYGSHMCCSFGGMIQYSFDFVQQVHFPSNPLHKCGLFGVSWEKDVLRGRQNNFCCMMWQVFTGPHKSKTISCLLIGHTSFCYDWCFGLVKDKGGLPPRHDSSVVSIAQLCGSEQGDMLMSKFDQINVSNYLNAGVI